MKTLIDKNSFISYYFFQDNEILVKQEGHWQVKDSDGVKAKIWDENLILAEDLTEPVNYKPAKYKIIDNEWVLNPFYIATE